MASIQLSEIIAKRDVKNRDIAVAVGTSEAVVSRWRSGVRPRPEYQAKLVAFLELTPAEIRKLGWEEVERV